MVVFHNSMVASLRRRCSNFAAKLKLKIRDNETNNNNSSVYQSVSVSMHAEMQQNPKFN